MNHQVILSLMLGNYLCESLSYSILISDMKIYSNEYVRGTQLNFQVSNSYGY